VGERLRLCGDEDFEKVYQRLCRPSREPLRSVTSAKLGRSSKSKTIFDQEIKALEFCSAALTRHYAEKVVPKEDLKELLIKVDDLYKYVWDLEIDERLKTTILEELASIQPAIHDYKIRGVEGLNETVATTMLIVVTVEKATPDNRNLIDKLRDLADDLIRIVTVGTFLYEIYGSLRKSLPPASVAS